MPGGHILDVALPEVQPSAAPSPGESIHSSPEDFGAFGAQATERFGAGLTQAGDAGLAYATQRQQFYNQIASDQGFNTLLEKTQKIKFGDPDDPSSKGYLNMSGQEAMDARKPTLDALEQARKDILKGLPTDKARLEFDIASRRLNMNTAGELGRHYDQQFKAWGVGIQNDLLTSNQRSVGLDPTNEDTFQHALEDSKHAATKAFQLGPTAGDKVGEENARNAAASRLYVTRFEALAMQPNGAAAAVAFLDKNKGNIDPQVLIQLQPRIEKLEGDAAGQGALGSASTNPQNVPRFVTQGVPGQGGRQQPAVTNSTADMIKHFEGFITDPKWDKTAMRVGYGSDTITRADGSVVKVQPGMTVTREDADRDLVRRIPEYQATIRGQIGDGAWGSLTPATQASLTSVAYNYGRLPNSVVAAAQTGDPSKIAGAVASLPANPKRRLEEARNILGYGVPFGSTFGDKTLTLPSQVSGAIAAPAPAPEPPSALPSAQPQTPPAPQNVTLQPSASAHPVLVKADAYAQIDEMEKSGQLSPGAAQHARQYISQRITAQQIAEQNTEKARKELSDQAEIEVFRDIHSENPKLTPDQILSNPQLSREAKERMVAQYEGLLGTEKVEKSYGRGFYDAYRRVHLPASDPERIADPSQLYGRVGPKGDLTVQGVDKLVQEIQGRKSPEGVAESEMRAQFLKVARAQITGSDEGLHIKDPKGDELYLKFLAQAWPAYDEGKRQGKTPTQLLNPDSPDYIGKAIVGFKRPMNQWFSDIINGDQTPETTDPAKFDPASIKTVEDAVTAYRAGKITKAQADQLAISRGWGHKKPEVPLPQ
jgi:GH24 family phage-related lysozyme (muramidase)